MKIQRHPRMLDIAIGDEVLNYRTNMYARVEDIFPAAVCVKLVVMRRRGKRWETHEVGQVWRADEIENLSRCCYCGTRDDLITLQHTHTPRRVCAACHSVAAWGQTITMVEAPAPFGEPG